MPTPVLSKRERFILTANGQETDRPPVWIMRQAGRYMPQYQALRERYGFRDLCVNPEAAVAASLLPLELLDIDILIIFNDILIPLEEMGLTVDFPGGGPQIMDPPRDESALDRFRAVTFDDPPVCQGIRLLRQKTDDQLAVLGFAGSPFTLLGYAVEGKLSRNAQEIRGLMLREPALVHEMLRRLTDTVVNYLVAQVESGGAAGVQVFESLGNILSPWEYEEFATRYTREVIARFQAACPGVPVILFSRGSSTYLELMESTGADVLSIDWTMQLADARRRTSKPLQGNLDPLVMTVPGSVEEQFARMLEGFDWRRGWIANLGHGIIPQASVEAAQRFVKCVQNLASK
jgi:uroporphyrinogen decarboxylase